MSSELPAYLQFGLRAIPFGIAAMILRFVLKSAGTQARPADTAVEIFLTSGRFQPGGGNPPTLLTRADEVIK
jgi:hypothetical protein